MGDTQNTIAFYRRDVEEEIPAATYRAQSKDAFARCWRDDLKWREKKFWFWKSALDALLSISKAIEEAHDKE